MYQTFDHNKVLLTHKTTNSLSQTLVSVLQITTINSTHLLATAA